MQPAKILERQTARKADRTAAGNGIELALSTRCSRRAMEKRSFPTFLNRTQSESIGMRALFDALVVCQLRRRWLHP